MKKIIDEENVRKNIYTYSISGIIILVAALILFNIEKVFDFISELISVLSPFLWGIFFAFIIARFAILLDRILPKKMSFKVKRLISSLTSVILLLLLIVLVISIIIPQLIESLSKLSSIIVNFTQNPTKWIDSLTKNNSLSIDFANIVYDLSNNLVSSIWDTAKEIIPNLVNVTVSTFSSLLNFVIGFIVALYILMDREKMAKALDKFTYTVLSESKYSRLKEIVNFSIIKFYKFFEGKLLDSLIIGVICFIVMSIFKLDFVVLISVIVGITNIIPFFGPFIGAVPSGLILLMVEPRQALIFVIMIIVLQQIDGNIIGPKILGDSVGLSSLWIMFAIIVGGAYFGFFGMLLGVPVFSVIYYLVADAINKKYKTKKNE